MIQITQLLKLKVAGRPVKTLLFSRVYVFGLGNFLWGCDKIEPFSLTMAYCLSASTIRKFYSEWTSNALNWTTLGDTPKFQTLDSNEFLSKSRRARLRMEIKYSIVLWVIALPNLKNQIMSLYPVLVFKGISHPNVTGPHHELSTSIKYFKRTLLLTLHIVGHFPKTILLPASSTKTLLHDQFLGFVSTMIKLAEGTFKILNLLQGFLWGIKFNPSPIHFVCDFVFSIRCQYFLGYFEIWPRAWGHSWHLFLYTHVFWDTS